MNRRVVQSQLQAGGTQGVDTYFTKVVKLIPSDIVAAWTFVAALISSASDVPATTVLWVAFAFAVVLTAFWTNMQTRQAGLPPAWRQIAVSTVAFAVWVFALGGPFAALEWYRPLYGTLILVAYTLIAPLIPLDS